MMKAPTTRFTRTADDVYLAYQTVGEGPLDVLWQQMWFSNVDVVWEWPLQARFFSRVASFSQLILHDARGTGLSGRNVAVPDLETRVSDTRHVLDAVGAERVVLGADVAGGAPNVLFAATDPERVRSLVWFNPVARATWAPDYPWGARPDEIERRLAALDLWGTEEYVFALNQGDDEGSIETDVLAKLARHTTSPDVAREYMRVWYGTDICELLPAVHVPALLMVHEEDADEREQAEYIASRMPMAQLAVLPRSLSEYDLNDDLDAIQRFLGVESEPDPDRVLATVLFTDIVDSTATAATMGDSRWRALIAEHDRFAQEVVTGFKGTFVRGTGDGLLATFDGPARGVRCAQALLDGMRHLGVEARAGLHTGEIEHGGNDLAGLAVHVAARVAAMAGPSEVWASSTVRDLTAGSGLSFEDAGEHELKGVPDRWRLFRVRG